MLTKSFGSAWKVSAAVASSIHEYPPNFEDSSICWSLPTRGCRKTVSVFGRQTLTQDRSFLAAVAQAIDDISDALPHIIRLPQGKAWIDYDEEADILYVGLKRPQKATDTKFLADQGILLRYRDKELVGVTVLDASKPPRKKKKRSS